MPVSPPAPTPAPVSELPDDRYLNRELSWLDFNARRWRPEDPSQRLWRTAAEAGERTLTLAQLERLGGVEGILDSHLRAALNGLSPREQLARIATRSQAVAEAHARVFLDQVRPELAEQGIRILRWSDLSEDQRQRLSDYFSAQVFPVLTPLAVDPAHPFPYISGLSLNLAVTVRDPGRTKRFARVKVPTTLRGWCNCAPATTRLPPRRGPSPHPASWGHGGHQCTRSVTTNADVEVGGRTATEPPAVAGRASARAGSGRVRLGVTDA